jgi:PIF1-like helicase
LLYLPWQDEAKEIEAEDIDIEKLYNDNIEIINANFKKYNAIAEDLQVIEKEIEADRAIQQQNEEEEDNIDGQNQQDFVNVFNFDDNVVQPSAAREMGDDPTICDPVKKYTVPGLLPDEAFIQLMDSLNEEQRDIVYHIDSCAKKNEKYHIFITGGAGTGKSHIIKAICQSLTRHYRSLQPDSEEGVEVLIVSFTGMAAHNVDGMTAHSAFHLSAGKGTKFSTLKPDIKNTMRSHLYRLKVLIIDEISMLSSIHLDQISLRLGEIFETPPGVHFGGISVLAVGDFFQLPPIAAPPAFKSKGGQGTAALVDNPQWALFKIFR